MKLKPTQKLLWKLITHPEGVACALKDYNLKKLPIVASKKLTEAERLDIYANMYFYRILEILESDYSAVAKYLGKTDFHNLITLYLQKYPPTHYSIRYVGKDLPLFLKEYPYYRKKSYLSELASLEWAILSAFDAPNTPGIHMDQLRQIPQNLWPKIQLRLTPSTRLLKTRYDLETWRKTSLKRKTPPKKQKKCLLVWRKELKVLIRKVEPMESRAMDALHQNVSLSKLSTLVSEQIGLKKTTQILPIWLNSWVEQGLLTSDNILKLK